jgi:hypothetical protein
MRRSVAQTLREESGPHHLSTNFHRRLLPLLSRRATIESVNVMASVLAGLAGVSLVVSGCGGSPSSGASTAPDQAALTFSRCMRSHGVPNFPDPDAHGDFPSFHLTVPKHAAAIANDTCKHLLTRGGGGATPQQRRQKLAFGLHVAQCLRRHGFPDFPDPTGSSQRMPPGINTDSPRFQAAASNCEERVRKALGLP